jgi:hypothetical protein
MTPVAAAKRGVRLSKRDGSTKAQPRRPSRRWREASCSEKGGSVEEEGDWLQEESEQVNQAEGQAEAVSLSDLVVGAVGGVVGAGTLEAVKWFVKRHLEHDELVQSALMDMVSTLGGVEDTLRRISTAHEPKTAPTWRKYPDTWMQTPPVIDRERYVTGLGNHAAHRHAITFFDALDAFCRASEDHANTIPRIANAGGVFSIESADLVACRVLMMRHCRRMLFHGHRFVVLLYDRGAGDTKQILKDEYAYTLQRGKVAVLTHGEALEKLREQRSA